PHGPVDADLTFIVRPTNGSNAFVTEGPEGPEGDSISDTKTLRVPVDDVRGQENRFNLDTHAFQSLQGVPSKATYEMFDSPDEIRQVYYPEVEDLLLNYVPGAQRVKILGHRVRKESSDDHPQPILFVHCDHTLQAADIFAKQHTDSEKELPQRRWCIINVWRSIRGVVQTTPMAFASAASLSSDDLFPIEIRSVGGLDWFTGIKYNPTQQWFYWSGMDINERLLLKCSDTKPDVGKQAFHSAFFDPRVSKDAKPRESIEVRTL
ncbi:hypothetical protein DM02DRAFT_470771, partial [Periconia macrospinosa]